MASGKEDSEDEDQTEVGQEDEDRLAVKDLRGQDKEKDAHMAIEMIACQEQKDKKEEVRMVRKGVQEVLHRQKEDRIATDLLRQEVEATVQDVMLCEQIETSATVLEDMMSMLCANKDMSESLNFLEEKLLTEQVENLILIRGAQEGSQDQGTHLLALIVKDQDRQELLLLDELDRDRQRGRQEEKELRNRCFTTRKTLLEKAVFFMFYS